MSTRIKLHERTDAMHDEMLRSEGIVAGAMGSLMGQLTAEEDYFDEFHDLVGEADAITVGDSLEDGPNDVADLFDGPTMVTERKVRQVSATVANSEDVSPQVIEWVESHVGDEVFSIHW